MTAANLALRKYGTGRRKNAVARVFLTPGSGQVTVNARPIAEYFPREALRLMLLEPLATINGVGQFDLRVTVKGRATAA